MTVKELQEELIKYNPQAEILFYIKGKNNDLCLFDGNDCDIEISPSLGRIVETDEVRPSLLITLDKTDYEDD